MTPNYRYPFPLLVLLLIFTGSAIAQQPSSKQLITRYDSLQNIAPKEKVYVHLDKNTYLAQDTIWFKAYLVDAVSNGYSQISELIYFDLIAEDGQVMQTLALPTALGFTWGSFAIKEEKYPAGTYTFRAYTRWLQNFGDTFVFKKKVQILDLSATATIPKAGKSSSSTISSTQAQSNNTKQKNDVQFLPESGNWLTGVYQKMAFKALGVNGKGIEINGDIVDSKQNTVTSFHSNKLGMGYFEMSPLAGETYTAKVNTSNGQITVALPNSKSIGTVIRLIQDTTNDSLNITVTALSAAPSLTLIGQSKGVLCFTANFKSGTFRKMIKIAKENFPAGVAQLILMDDKNHVLNERTFFIEDKQRLNIVATTPKSEYTVRDSIPLKIKVTDQSGKPISGSFSLSITDDFQVVKDPKNDENLLSYLLMTSDLKGDIENPGYYFHKVGEQITKDLDALMLTQGWVSYTWTAKEKPLLKPEKEYTIRGKVTNLANKPSVGAKIIMLGKNKSTMLIDTLTNQNGEFVFDHLPPMDSASFVIQALNSKGKKGTLGITVNEFQRPSYQPNVKNSAAETIAQFPDSTAMQQVASRNLVYQTALKSGIILREVKISGKKIVRGSNNLNGPGEASQLITEENMAGSEKKTLFQLLQEKVKGFNICGRNSENYCVNGDLVKFVFDGVELDFFYDPDSGGSLYNNYYYFVKDYLDYYSAEDIRGIEVMNNGYSFAYKSKYIDNPMDMRTYSFIEITTKTGSGPFLKKSSNLYLIKPVNYGLTKTFFSPKYSSSNPGEKTADLRSTLLWEPNVETNKNGEAKVSFFSSDKKGTYSIWLEGADAKGGLGISIGKITIK